MFNFIENNIESIIAWVSASSLFLIALCILKPKIKICDKIAVEEIDSKDAYVFKIINKSWFFKVYDIKVNLYSMEAIPSENNDDHWCVPLALRKDNQWYLNRINPYHLFQNLFHGNRRLKSRTDYAVQFISNENLKDLLNSNKTIRFEVLAKHSLSGFSVVKVCDYKHRNDLITGSFLSGNTSCIKN